MVCVVEPIIKIHDVEVESVSTENELEQQIR